MAEPTQYYYCFRDFLSESQRNEFFDMHYMLQIELFEEYLDFLAQVPVLFTNSIKKSTCTAKICSSYSIVKETISSKILLSLIDGIAVSGFGAQGTVSDYLPQRKLSMLIARLAGELGHQYQIEKKKNAPLVLNSRSFYSYWCHAEKQKYMDIKLKLTKSLISNPKDYWEKVVLYVDREMCNDCISFFKTISGYDSISISISDPKHHRIFHSSGKVLTNKISL